jgi:hypothetical protein
VPNWTFPWGIYTAVARILSDGDAARPSLDVAGNLKISEGVKVTGETLSTGGSGIIGWLSEIANRLLTNVEQTENSTTAPKSKTISFDTDFQSKTSSATAYKWLTYQTWTVPGSAVQIFVPLSFEFQSTGNIYGRLIEKALLATSQNGTAFTDGTNTADVTKEYWTDIEVQVITAVNANCTFTITYKNEANTAGRTATVAITTAMAAGTRVRMTLQGTDQGLIDITNVTQSVGITAGKVEIYGIKNFATLAATHTNQTDTIPAPISFTGAAMRGGRQVSIEYASSDTSSSQTMRGSFIGNLQDE